jgi:DNA polymerase-3 subunit epsilon
MYAFIDTETTGLPIDGVQPRVVSIAWLIVDHGNNLLTSGHRIVKPDGFMIPHDATIVHGITTERALREGTPLNQTLKELERDIRTHEPSVMVAHNLGFDRAVVDAEFGRLGLRSPLVHLDGVCTVRMAQKRWPTQAADLANVYKKLLGSLPTKKHDASADVEACRRVFFALVNLSSSDDLEDQVDEENSEIRSMIDRILDWAADCDRFDPSFVENLLEQFEERGTLSEKQVAALENIIEKWHIP